VLPDNSEEKTQAPELPNILKRKQKLYKFYSFNAVILMQEVALQTIKMTLGRNFQA
jgi:hypothetical protein